MILKLYIRNLWELVSLVWSGTSPREMCGQKPLPVSGSGSDSTQMEFTMGPSSGPTKAAQKRPLSWASFNYNERSPGSLKDAASGWPLFFFLDCFHFFIEGCPLRSTGIGMSLDLAGEREKEVHGGLQNWITPPPWPLASKNRPLCSERQGSPSFSGFKKNQTKTTSLQPPLLP